MKDAAARARLDALAVDVQRRADGLGIDASLWNVGIFADHRDPYFRVSPEELDRLLRVVAASAHLRESGQEN